MSFLQTILDATEQIESPRAYIKWAGLAALSAVTKANLYIDKQNNPLLRLYPNIYVLLVGPPGIRKAFPVRMAEKLVRTSGSARIVGGRSSFQSLISALSEAKTSENGGGPKKDSTAFIVNDELSTALVRDADAYTILTTLYDHKEVWENTLKSTGVERLENAHITLLGALNETHFNDVITDKEIQGGFISRSHIILEKKRHCRNSLLRGEWIPFPYEELGKYLSCVGKLHGQMILEEDAIDFFEDWYDGFEAESINDKTGTANRIHDHILKISMLLSLSDGLNMRISLAHMQESFNICSMSASSVDKVTVSSGNTSEYSSRQKLVIAYLMAKEPHYCASRSEILSRNLGGLDYMDLDRIAENLETAGLIVSGTERKHGKTETTYTLTKKFFDVLGSKLRGEKQ